MPSVLITAFEPYDHWRENSSWLALLELTRDLPSQPAITTRLYPVDFGTVQERLAADLRANHDFALHLGQAPGATMIRLEAIGINVAGLGGQRPGEFGPLVVEGPTAFRSRLPLADWAIKLREQGIPAEVSFHAGTYLCNAALYLSCYLSEQMSLRTRSAFVHLPLETRQAAEEAPEMASLPAAASAQALRLILAELARE